MQWAHIQTVDHERCEHCQPLRMDTNVLVLARLTVLNKLSDYNLVFSLCSLLFLAVNVVLMVVTIRVISFGESLVDPGVFHTLDFGSTFLFSLVEVLTLVYSPERRFSSPTLLKFLMFVNVCSTFTALLFITLNRSVFERLSHNIDYFNELSMALIDALLVSTILIAPMESPTPAEDRPGWCVCFVRPKLAVAAATLIPILISGTQLMVYNAFGVDTKGHVLGERAAHVLEFAFNAIGATINFWFCLDSKFLADQLTRQIMLAPDEMRTVIDPLSPSGLHNPKPVSRPTSFEHTHSHSPLYRPPGAPNAVGWSASLSEPFLLPQTLAHAHGAGCGCGDCPE